MSPRLSGKELAEHRKKKREQEEKERLEEESKAQQEYQKKQIRLSEIDEQLEQTNLILAFHAPIYNEIDKLNKKAPKEALSNYTLAKVNEHIKRIKSFLPEDPYISEINHFEPAGDNPEYRDVILALAEIGVAINRYHEKLIKEKQSLNESSYGSALGYIDDFSIDVPRIDFD